MMRSPTLLDRSLYPSLAIITTTYSVLWPAIKGERSCRPRNAVRPLSRTGSWRRRQRRERGAAIRGACSDAAGDPAASDPPSPAEQRTMLHAVPSHLVLAQICLHAVHKHERNALQVECPPDGCVHSCQDCTTVRDGVPCTTIADSCFLSLLLLFSLSCGTCPLSSTDRETIRITKRPVTLLPFMTINSQSKRVTWTKSSLSNASQSSQGLTL